MRFLDQCRGYDIEGGCEIDLLPDPEAVMREMVITRVKQRYAELRRLKSDLEKYKAGIAAREKEIADYEAERDGLLDWLSSQSWISPEDVESLRTKGREVNGVGFLGEKED